MPGFLRKPWFWILTVILVAGIGGFFLLKAGAAQKKKMKELSKGMAQKVQLIAAVVHRPEFVILDEPFSGLDPMNQQGLEAMIRGLAANGATVLFSTHVMQHAERLCDKVVLLARGRKAFEGTVTEARATSREVTGEIVAQYFTGRIHHHVTEANLYPVA